MELNFIYLQGAQVFTHWRRSAGCCCCAHCPLLVLLQWPCSGMTPRWRQQPEERRQQTGSWVTQSPHPPRLLRPSPAQRWLAAPSWVPRSEKSPAIWGRPYQDRSAQPGMLQCHLEKTEWWLWTKRYILGDSSSLCKWIHVVKLQPHHGII